jgi:hypothetical protein
MAFGQQPGSLVDEAVELALTFRLQASSFPSTYWLEGSPLAVRWPSEYSVESTALKAFGIKLKQKDLEPPSLFQRSGRVPGCPAEAERILDLKLLS